MVHQPAVEQQAGLGREGEHGGAIGLVTAHPLAQGSRGLGTDEGQQHELAETADLMLPGGLLQGHQSE